MRDLYGIPEQAIDPESYYASRDERQARRDARADERDGEEVATSPTPLPARIQAIMDRIHGVKR